MRQVVARLMLLSLMWPALANFSNAQAPRIISASFYNPLNPVTGPLLNTSIAGVPATQVTVPAVMRRDNWNNLAVPFGAQLDLFDSFGAFTSVDAAWISSGITANGYTGGPLDGDSTMMNGLLFDQNLSANGRVTITLSDLANTFNVAAGYEVFIYADRDGVGDSQSLLVDDGIHAVMALTMTDTGVAGQPFDSATDYDEGTLDGLGVWARFTGLTGGALQITAESLSVGDSAFINGIQIVGTPLVPEPSVVALAAIAMSMLTGIARRSR